MGEIEAISKTILDRKIGVKNSKMENWYKNPESIKKFLGQKIDIKNYFVQKMEKIVLGSEKFWR